MTAEKVLDVARAELGYVESPPNSNRTKYGKAYPMDGNAWCAMFVWWVFREAEVSELIPKTAYTPTFADWFRKRGAWSTKPRPGAIVFFDFPNDGVNRISHVGIVEAVFANGDVQCIEGNTSPGNGGSQRDGGGVWRRVRRAGIVGYGYPAYSGAPAAPAKEGAPAAPGRTLRLASPFMRGDDVKELQRVLVAWYPNSGVVADGVFGPVTKTAVENMQRNAGLTIDGVAGPATFRALNMS